ncbi:site-specific integrase [Halobacterium sp. CBA1126]|uniref:tyrosine-type recombinase/integrase n=1 Tax=Halobacterium sp. CBA1126 TaxID=2668074 RepID=UPI0018D24A15|nr:site-specific integrase [Halobacterium sp. CBA1126]
MADLNDVQNYARKFQNQLAKVDEAPIDDRDREAIHDWVRHLDASGDRNQGTITSLLNRIRLSAERSDTPLVDMDRSDVDALLFDLKHDYDLGEGTRRNYRKALKQFHDWRGEDWVEDFTIGASPDRSVDPNDLLTDDEIQALLDAAGKPRDQALIAMLADTGLRIGALASLRIRDLDLAGQTTLISINEAANVKDASGTVPLTWSEGHLTGYLHVHPRRDVEDAPVFHKDAGYYDGGDDGALAYQYLARRVKEVADQAGVPREKANLHNFRHTAISNWIRDGLSEQAIKHRASWEIDSDMLETYAAVRDEEFNDQILDHYDLATSEDGEASRPELEACPRCSTALMGTERFCPSCAAPLSAGAADAVEGVEDRAFESMAAADTGDAELVAEFRERFQSDPGFRERVLGDHDDTTASSSSSSSSSES